PAIVNWSPDEAHPEWGSAASAKKVDFMAHGDAVSVAADAALHRRSTLEECGVRPRLGQASLSVAAGRQRRQFVRRRHWKNSCRAAAGGASAIARLGSRCAEPRLWAH